jgi:plastocyanin
MRPAVIAVAIATVALCLVACSTEEPGWTYAPPPTEVAASGAPSGEPGSPAPSGEVSPAPSEAPSAAPSGSASAAPASAAPSGSAPASPASGEVVTATATNITWEQADLEVAADTPFTLELVNNDASVPHNVDIRDQAGTSLFTTDTFPGVETRSFDAPALTAGAYQFVCTVHPNMIIDVNAT